MPQKRKYAETREDDGDVDDSDRMAAESALADGGDK
ncbi:hypothetical protein THARTR1_11261 [Trichoderma harzianum]|uniref:Uncharacterized protein n=1 Tax=Trichoderma harzianum TaxID=5544 RepID=A0A2K0T3R6_TRIHA|nr:hypothetical protein THARTR1_11261 [Trichoderma harzianum]